MYESYNIKEEDNLGCIHLYLNLFRKMSFLMCFFDGNVIKNNTPIVIKNKINQRNRLLKSLKNVQLWISSAKLLVSIVRYDHT